MLLGQAREKLREFGGCGGEGGILRQPPQTPAFPEDNTHARVSMGHTLETQSRCSMSEISRHPARAFQQAGPREVRPLLRAARKQAYAAMAIVPLM